VQASVVIAYCTGLIAVCTVLLLVTTILTIRSYNILRDASHGTAGAHDETPVRRGTHARHEEPAVTYRAPAPRAEPPASDVRPQPAAREPQAAAREPQAAAREPQAAAREPQAAARPPKAQKKRNIPIARYDSELDSTMGATEWTGPVTPYIPENRSTEKP
jgi:hypothetical protein